MTLLWPEAFLAYLLVPAFVGFYVWAVRRRPWRRHVPAVCYLITLCAMILALARPVWPIPVSDNQTAVMLSLDVSGSMIATDVYPSRIEAAKKTATEFVRALPAGATVGLVKFSTHATLVTPPTDDHDRVVAALDALRPEASTAVGDGLLEAVYALPERGGFGPAAAAGDPPAAAADPATLPPAAVVLLSDGGNNTGSPPDQAALVARRLRVIVHTVGLGSPQGAAPDVESHALDEALDENMLKKIAAVTDVTYHRAASQAELARAYSGLGRMIVWKRRPKELSGLFSAAPSWSGCSGGVWTEGARTTAPPSAASPRGRPSVGLASLGRRVSPVRRTGL